jgi:cytochrome P450
MALLALRNYESRVIRYADELIRQLSTFAGKPVNICQWLYYFTFDVMGDLSFGKSFDMLKTGQAHPAVKLLKTAMPPLGWMAPAPWIIPVLLNTVGAGPMSDFINWSEKQIVERKKMKPAEPDIMSYIIGSPSAKFKTAAEEHNWLVGDSRLIVVAGSDTTNTTLAFACYHLAKDPSHVEKLRAELEKAEYEMTPTNLSILQNLDHLNGVINESLRLHPPLPGGVPRLSPPEGLFIGGHFIPGNINILTPSWVIQRCK